MQANASDLNYKSPFFRLLIAHMLLVFGDWLFKISLPLYVYQLTGSASDMATTFALTYLPYLLFSLVGGIAADRLPRKTILFLSNFINFLLLVFIVLSENYSNGLMLFYILVFLVSSINPIIHPSFQSIIPELVSQKNLSKANSLISGVEYLAQIVIPTLAGVLVAILGAKQTILINSLFFLFSSFLILSIPAIPILEKSNKGLLETIKEGFHYAWSHPVLKYGSLLFIGSNFAINIFQANFIFYLSDMLNTSSEKVGVIFTMTGIAAIIGASIAPKIIKHFHSGRIIIASTILAGLLSFLLLIIKNPFGIGFIWSLVMICGSINVVTYFTLRQQSVPREVLGRAVAITRLISFSSIPVAAFLGGYIVENINFYLIIWLCASVRLLTGLLAAFTPLARAK